MKFGMYTGLDGTARKNYVDIEIDNRNIANIKLIRTQVNPFTNAEEETIYEGTITLQEV